MNLSPVVTASSTPPSAEVSRSGEPAPAGEFSSVLSQQQGQVRERGAATTQAASKSAQAPAEERDAPVPDETLALLAAGATLPLMVARAELTAEPGNMAARGTRLGGGAALTTATTTLHVSADTAKSILAEAQTLMTVATAARSDAVGMIPAADQPMLAASTRTAESIALATTGTSNARAGSARPHAALTPAANAAQLAAARTTTKLDAAQATFTQIASAIGLNTQPVSISATSALDSRAIQDAANALAGAAQAQGTSSTLLTTQTSLPTVATPLSSPAWAADFSRQFVSMTQGRDMSQPHTIELRLDPPSLGPVRITMHISDSIAQASFVSPHAVVRQAIENALPQLQQQLTDAGLSLGQANVSDQQAGQGSEQQASSQNSRSQSVFSLDGGSTTSDISAPSAAPRQTPRSPDALVDTFA